MIAPATALFVEQMVELRVRANYTVSNAFNWQVRDIARP